MISDYIAKAEENIRAARLLFENELYDASANRAYFAAFQATAAALERFGIEFETLSHKSLQARFSGELIGRRRLFPSELKSDLLDLQNIRNRADYSNSRISKAIAAQQLKQASTFVNEIQRRLSS